MPVLYRLCLGLLAVPAFAGAQSSTVEHFDCLINPAVSGLVSCLPPEDHSSLEYQWDMGDGTVYTSDESHPHIYHTYSQPGEYTVTLTVNRHEVAATTQSVLSIPEPLEEDASSQLAGGDFR
ncbi:PKD domain-containing protein [Marinimicrobium agarilyticum]|uniref:PKD domain-containing protein n=1 Tax=Marinimicrobium agarilyticum TaxID=306546 RepID=UPI0003FBCF9A|nr:PKD domain-containing protein [Marinimicrobium agarilyticum]